MNVIQSRNGYQDEFSVHCDGSSVRVLTDPYAKSFNILYLNQKFNSHGALHLLLNTTQDAEALRAALSKAIAHRREAEAGVALGHSDQLVEAVAKAIYEQWVAAPGYVAWVEGGNSLNQDDARRLARKALDGVDSSRGGNDGKA